MQVRDFLDKYLVYYLRTCRRQVLSQVRAFWGRLRTPVRSAAWGAFEQVCRPVAVAGFGLALLAIGGNITDRPMRVYWKYKTKYAIQCKMWTLCYIFKGHAHRTHGRTRAVVDELLSTPVDLR